MNISSDVIVTGVTPAGLAAALRIAKNGAKVTLVDFDTDKSPPRDILLVYPSTLEALDQIGAAEPLLARGEKVTSEQFWYRDAGKKVAELSYDALVGATKFPFQLACRWSDIIETLNDLIEAEPNIHLVTHVAPIEMEQSEIGVHLTCQGPEGQLTLDAAHAILTHEGGHKMVGIDVEYLLTDHRFLIAECEADLSEKFEGIDSRAVLLGEGTLAALTRLGTTTRLVYQFLQRNGRAAPDAIDPEGTLNGLLGEDAERKVLSLRDVTMRHYIADNLFSGRVCLAGATAYCFDTPVTSIGLNAQVQDGCATADAILRFGTEGPGALLAHDRDRQAINLRLLGLVSNAYYDVTANSAQDLRLGKFEARMSQLSASKLQTQNFLMQQNLMPPIARELATSNI